MISVNNNNYNYQIDEFNLFKFENVKEFNYSNCTPILNLTFFEKNISNQIKDYYFIFDNPGSDAFAHWVYESFIFVPYLQKITNKYPEVKIVLKNTKKYTYNLFKFFKIQNEILNSIENENNICFFPPIFSLNDNNLDLDNFNQLIKVFSNYIMQNIKPLTSNNILLLPRNSKENFAPNDRIIHGIDDIEKNIIELGGSSLDTFLINNIDLQFTIINSFNILILDYGSSFLVNCIFVKNKKIVLLDNYHLFDFQINNFKSMKSLFDIINKNNKVFIIKPRMNNRILFEDIKNLL